MKLLRRNKVKPVHEYANEEILEVGLPETSGTSHQEVAAVISLALNMYVQQMREYEQAIITIQKVIKPYSPWSSKIYGLRQSPNHIPGLRLRFK
jgi:hypothetical protein